MKKIITDGNSITAYIAYLLTDIASIYPITPSSNMAEKYDELKMKNEKNIFNQIPDVVQMQSESGSIATLHGSLSAGALGTTFTSSQGLLLMIPNMYKIAGEMLPAVIHVASRSVAGHALNIFCDHSDVMAVRQTGFCMLCSCNVQECQDMALISHLASIESSLPFLHFFDGFRTSHEIQKIDYIETEDIKKLINYDKVQAFKNKALNPEHPHLQGSAHNPDIYFQNKEAVTKYYNKVSDIVSQCFEKLAKLTQRNYQPFEYYGCSDAESIIIAMGSSIDTIKQSVDFLNNAGKKYGVINVRLYRPFSVKHFLNVLPKTVKNITVLDRTKESGSLYEPLCLDVISALQGRNVNIIGGRYGLGSKEFTPAMVKAVFDNMESENSINHFTVGINDDVTHTSLNINYNFDLEENTYNCKFYGLGSDGTVSANKNSIKIIGELTDYYCQGYFEYDSKKSGSLTVSHLRFGKQPIHAPYLINNANFIACHNDSYIKKYDLTKELGKNGIFLLNTSKTPKELNRYLPLHFKKFIRDNNIKFYAINAYSIADNCNLRDKINTVMQACFFKLVNIAPYNVVKNYIYNYIRKTYLKKGEEIVNNNIKAVELAEKHLREIKLDLKSYESPVAKIINSDFYNQIMMPILNLEGNKLPVSCFSANGYMPTDTSKYEKRGIAKKLPDWISEHCIQCNKCSLVCPHSCINALLIDNNEKLPRHFKTIKANGVDAKFRIQINPLDCTGCGNCANVCPALKKALEMKNAPKVLKQEQINYDFSQKLQTVASPFKKNTVKGSQFYKSYFQFSGACAGCGETPYIKLVTQLCGEDMIIANATGCSSIYGGSYPSCPYSKNLEGFGPAWANSLFEDNAEFGYGIALAYKARRNNLRNFVISNIAKFDNELKTLLNDWLITFDDREKNKLICKSIKNIVINNHKSEESHMLYNNLDVLTKKVIWIIGGDGWAYDIGFGGLDHILSTGEDVKILVLNTQVYSNTGGQMSKATPFGASAKFAVEGKKKQQKDLALYAMTYKDVYVAQVSMGADNNQCVKAFNEALEHKGTSLIIAYAPCINHGIDMSNTQNQMSLAVKTGFWNLFRFNPNSEKQFTLDSKAPTVKIIEYLNNEVRFNEVIRKNPSIIGEIEDTINDKYEQLKKLEN